MAFIAFMPWSLLLLTLYFLIFHICPALLFVMGEKGIKTVVLIGVAWYVFSLFKTVKFTELWKELTEEKNDKGRDSNE